MSLQKHLLNTPATLVSESLQGVCALNPQLGYDSSHQVVYKTNVDPNKVALICGGGSGHEPSHAGFVGKGMLSAAVCGNIFASPNAGQVRRGIDLVDNNAGTLIIVKNYTGDVLNFGLAKEQYAAEHGDKADKVKFLVVGEDVAVGKTQGDIVGRRGLAGVVLVYKIAGALAENGGTINEVYDIAEWVSKNVGTIGVGLEHCHVPGTATGESHLSADEIEIGLGIHNEAGNQRISPAPPLDKLIAQLLDLIVSTSDSERSFLPFQNDSKDEVVLLVNNLGGLSELELGGIVRSANDELKKRKIAVARVIAGTFMTSLNMPGFSITLLLLPRSGGPSKDTLLSLLDAKPDTLGWKWTAAQVPNATIPVPASAASTGQRSTKEKPLSAASPKDFIASIEKACHAVIEAEPEITRMDTIAGDGDCGLTLKAGAAGVLDAIKEGRIQGTDLVGDVVAIAKVAEKVMGGTSGALYSIFFSSLAQGLEANVAGGATNETWNKALVAALAKLYTYTRARPPSRTLIDPLAAFVEGLQGGYASATNAAAAAAEHTKDVQAKAGRSAYVSSDLLTKERVADPGAWGVRTILNALFL